MRIASLLPAATDIVAALGRADDLVAVTYECDPEIRKRATVVVDTALPAGLDPAAIDAVVRDRAARGLPMYELDRAALAALDPDLILTQDLCEVCAVSTAGVDEALAHLGCDGRVLTVDPGTLEEVIGSVTVIGHAVGRESRAATLVDSLRSRLAVVATAVEGRPRPRVAVLEWTEPPFAAGHWVPDMVQAAGGTSVLGTPGRPSVTTSWDEVDRAAAEVVVVAPCGYHLDGAAAQARAAIEDGRLPGAALVWAVDADAAFVRPGPRLVDGVEAMAAALHPGALPARPDLARRIR